ncbi:hypothetical protein Tco_1245111 [Tanacetum coccineum]
MSKSAATKPYEERDDFIGSIKDKFFFYLRNVVGSSSSKWSKFSCGRKLSASHLGTHYFGRSGFPKAKAHTTVITSQCFLSVMIWMQFDLIVMNLNTAKFLSWRIYLPLWFRRLFLKVAVQNSNSSAQQDDLILSLERYKEQVKVLKEGQTVDLKSQDNVSDSCAQSVEIDHLKRILSEHLKERNILQTDYFSQKMIFNDKKEL